VGTALDVSHWPTRKYKKYRAYLLWMRRVESYAPPDDEEEDEGPRWWVEDSSTDEPSWETESFTRPR
jgi:hypothetical protein